MLPPTVYASRSAKFIVSAQYPAGKCGIAVHDDRHNFVGHIAVEAASNA